MDMTVRWQPDLVNTKKAHFLFVICILITRTNVKYRMVGELKRRLKFCKTMDWNIQQCVCA